MILPMKPLVPNRLTSDRLLECMQEGSQPTTSQVNVGQFEEVFSSSRQKW